MDFPIFRDRILKLELKGIMHILVHLIFIIGFIVEGAIMLSALKNQKTIIVPAYINKRFYIEGNKASRDYIEAVYDEAVLLLYSFTPDYVEEQYESFLKYLPPDSYNEMALKLRSNAKDFKNNMISRSYTIQHRRIENNKYYISGILRTYVQDKPTEQIRYDIEVTYKIDSGGSFIEQIKEFKK